MTHTFDERRKRWRNCRVIRELKSWRGNEAKGRMDSLWLAVEAVCEALGIEIDDERKNALRRLDVDGLTALLGRLRSERQWPHED